MRLSGDRTYSRPLSARYKISCGVPAPDVSWNWPDRVCGRVSWPKCAATRRGGTNVLLVDTSVL